MPLSPDDIAEAFHAAYESLAPELGYDTREESAVPWADVPEANRRLMTRTVEALLAAGTIRPGHASLPAFPARIEARQVGGRAIEVYVDGEPLPWVTNGVGVEPAQRGDLGHVSVRIPARDVVMTAVMAYGRAVGIDVLDERSNDSDDFPKVVFRDQIENESCASCDEELS